MNFDRTDLRANQKTRRAPPVLIVGETDLTSCASFKISVLYCAISTRAQEDALVQEVRTKFFPLPLLQFHADTHLQREVISGANIKNHTVFDEDEKMDPNIQIQVAYSGGRP
ncbi:hypothetical protein B296_00021389 [Ensete ventricosum]|uniref:Uncharacterized protein n=1 Tax=Ensete ventricosum TaxID=4639 RepID=A0A427A3J2_ENSVE|nr:hypothetical protein B296_00021389 [Ensete ventricosum]